MHMNNNIIFFIATVGLLLSGCAKEEETGVEGIPMRVAASLSGDTKASMQADDLSEFYLHVKSGNPQYDFFGKFTKSDSEWSSGNMPYWESNSASVTCSAAFFDGHAFTEQEFADGVDLSVPIDQSTEGAMKSADLVAMSAKTVKFKDTNNGVLSVELGHGLSKVNFVLTLSEIFHTMNVSRSGNPVLNFTVSNVNSGFTFKSGSVTVKAGTETLVTPFAGDYTPSTSANKTATAIYEAIMPPQAFAAGELKVTFEILGTEYTWTNASAITLEPGKTYNLPISADRPDYYNGHEYVDLGLSVKWATCNIGADNPWDYGDYFAWGETETKTEYSLDTYFDTNDGGNTFMKYTTVTNTILDAVDDAATANWGAAWRMPTIGECDELMQLEKHWVMNYNGLGVNGYTFTGNGNTLFLPAAGSKEGSVLSLVGLWGHYWLSTLDGIENNRAHKATFYSSGAGLSFAKRYLGYTVRPVTK